MKHIRLFIVAGLWLVLAAPVMAASESPIHMNNRLRLGYDDNIYQAGTGGGETHAKESSVRVIEELELLVNLNLERTSLGLRYRPALIWYQNREPDNTDFTHDVDFNFTYAFNPSLTLSINDTLRASQLPELQDDNYVVRGNDDNYYNSAIATLSINLRPQTRLDLSGRIITLTYTGENVRPDGTIDDHRNDNYYSLVGGLTLRQQLASRTTVQGDLRYQALTYNEADLDNNRNAGSVFAGLGLEQTFSPQIIGSMRAGMESRMYDADNYKDNTAPYGELAMTFLPTPATRITGAGSYSIYESDVARYLSQNRTYLSLSLAHDFTAKWTFYITGAYTLNAYEKDYALVNELEDGNENSYLVSARLAYQVNRINWVEVGGQFVKFDSDLQNRESYVRNRIDIGWKIQLF